LSVFNAYYQDPRFRPSICAARTGSMPAVSAASQAPVSTITVRGARKPAVATVCRHRRGPRVLEGLAIGPRQRYRRRADRADGWTERACSRAAAVGHPVILLDLTASSAASVRGRFSRSRPNVPIAACGSLRRDAGPYRALPRRGFPNWPGLVVMRTVAMLAKRGVRGCHARCRHRKRTSMRR